MPRLSSPYLYSIIKAAHIEIPSLWTDIGSTPNIPDTSLFKIIRAPPIPLGRVVQGWIGTRYQPSSYTSCPWPATPNLPFFIRKSKNPFSSASYSKRYDQMIVPYRDYDRAFRDGQHRLPDPRHKTTKMWNEEAKAAIIADAANFWSFSSWGDFWYERTSIESGAHIWRLDRWDRVVIWENFYDREFREKNPGKNRTSWEREWCKHSIYWGIVTMPAPERHLVTLGLPMK